MTKLFLPVISCLLLCIGCGTTTAKKEPSTVSEKRIQPQTTSDARKFAKTVSVNLNDPLESVLSKMPGTIIPEKERQGDRRIFTYVFPDKSSIRLTFVPAGPQGSGLKLYTVEMP
jgi:hypothetical protein